MALALAVDLENRRALEADKKQSLAAAQTKAVDEIKKIAVKATKQTVLRIINVAFAATLVGILVAYAIMTFQLIVGNLFGVKSIKLSGWEIAIWVFLALFLLTIGIIFLFILEISSDPAGLIGALFESLWQWLKS